VVCRAGAGAIRRLYNNIIALKSVGQELSEAVAIAEKAAAGKAISGGLVKEKVT